MDIKNIVNKNSLLKLIENNASYGGGLLLYYDE
jgi:hypothetical protein